MIINSWSIIPNEILYIPKFKTINIHPSLLPQYRGALPTLWALKNRDSVSALTYLVLNDSVDDGLIIGQHKFGIDSSDNWRTLEDKIYSILKETLANDTLNYLNNNFKKIKIEKEPSYTGLYNRYRKTDLINEDFADIYNKINLYPYLEPFFYCFIYILNKKIYIKNSFLYKGKNKDLYNEPGNIILDNIWVLFCAKNGIIKSRLFIDIKIRDSFFIIFNKLTNKI